MDHVEVLMRLFEANGRPLALPEIERATRLGPATVERCAQDLVKAHLASHDPAARTYAFATSTVAERGTVAELAVLYNQRPVTLVRLIYSQPPSPVKSFADAFRLRPESEDK
jgi:hypothetical protein